jgi:hypothetical protein
MTIMDIGYSPPPTGSRRSDFLYTKQGGLASTSTVTHQPRLSACRENYAHGFLHLE